MLKDKKFLKFFDNGIQKKFTNLPLQLKGMSVSEDNARILVDCNLQCDMFNVICSRPEITPDVVSRSINYFNAKKLPYAYWIGFEEEPVWLENELLNLGLTTNQIETAMAYDLTENSPKLVNSEFDIRQVSDIKGIKDVILVLNEDMDPNERESVETFFLQAADSLLSGNCPQTYFVGYANNIPISLGSNLVIDEFVAIFDIVVIPTMRHRGFGKSMTIQAMIDGKKKGCSTSILTATNDAKFLYQKIGFEYIKTMKVYREPLPAPSP